MPSIIRYPRDADEKNEKCALDQRYGSWFQMFSWTEACNNNNQCGGGKASMMIRQLRGEHIQEAELNWRGR